MDSTGPLMNGPLSDSAASNGQPENVDLQAVLDGLTANGTLSLSEQQVVLQEDSKEKRFATLLSIISGKGLSGMESFLKCMAQQQAQHGMMGNPGSYYDGGYSGTTSTGSTPLMTGNQTNHRDQPPTFSSSSSTLDTVTFSHNPSLTSNDRSPVNRFPISSSSSGINDSSVSSGGFSQEISKAIEEKFGRSFESNVRNNVTELADEKELEVDMGMTDQTMAGQKVHLPSIPETQALSADLSGYMVKSPNMPNRNMDGSQPMSLAGSSMVAQLLGLSSSSSNANKSSNYVNTGQDTVDAAVASGPATGGSSNEEHDQWEFHQVSLSKLPPYGFGIAVSGGRDNPHFANGDPSIAVSDVLKTGPAEGRLFINDRIISVNGVNLENVDYAYAVTILKDSPSTVNLTIKRRSSVPTPPTPSLSRNLPTSYTVTLPKPTFSTKKKDDCNGLVLGCILYVKDITNRSLLDQGIQVGDTVLRIGPTPVDHLTFHEVRKVLDKRPKDRLPIVFQRPRGTRSAVLHNGGLPLPLPASNPNTPPVNQHRRQSSQNVYTELPTKADNHVRQKSVDSMEGRLVNAVNRNDRGHAMRSSSMNLNLVKADGQRVFLPSMAQKVAADGFVSMGNRPENGFPITSPYMLSHSTSKYAASDNYQDAISLSSDWRFPDPRFVSFRKDGSVGLRLTGGNDAGIFVAASQPGSPAALAGLVAGDKILKVNDKDMKSITREEAVLFLLNLNEQIEMVVQQRKQEFDYIIANQSGDSFYIRSHFTYDPDNKNDLSFQPGDVFRVLDTLHTGSVGSWFVSKLSPNKVESAKGSIPSAGRAEEIAKTVKNGPKCTKQYSSNTLADRIRRRSRRAKSLNKDQWEEVAFAGLDTKFSAYERIILKMPHFLRPVVFYGPLADIARDKLVQEFPERYANPQMESPNSEDKGGIIRLSVIRQMMSQNKHCVLDVTCQAVDRLNFAQMYPIVIFMKADSKDIVKEIRSATEVKRKSTKKLIMEAQKLEKSFSFLFTGVVPLKSKTSWFRSLCEMIEQQQQTPIWMSEKPPESALADDFLFPMASSLYNGASSGPESDGESMYDVAPPPPPRRVSRDDSAVNGLGPKVRSPPIPSSQSLYNGVGSHPESHYDSKPSNASCDFKENRPLPPNYQILTSRAEIDGSHHSVDIFATLRQPKLITAGTGSNFSRRPRPPPITVPSSGDDKFTGKPSSSISMADIPTSLSSATPSTSGTYEDPKSYDPYRYTRSTNRAQSFGTSTTLDRDRRPRAHTQQVTYPIQHTNHSPTQPSNVPSNSPSKPNGYTHHAPLTNGYTNSGELHGNNRVPVIKEEQAPPLPPKPKYLTNGRLKMFQNGHGDNASGDSGRGESLYGESGSKEGVANGTYGKLPARPYAQKCVARPIFVEPNEANSHHKMNGHRSHHDSLNFPFADDERGISPSQLNFPPPPDDFLNSPKKLHPPDVLAEVRGFFDYNGGVLTSEETGVSLVIPTGAIPHGVRQEVYFKVCREDNILSTLDREKGERLLSPCVLCGPSGLTFLKPLELKLPHSGSSRDSPSYGIHPLKSPLSKANGVLTERDQIYQSKQASKMPVSSGSVSVFVDRF